MDPIRRELALRMKLIEEIKMVFLEIYPHYPTPIPRGVVQEAIFREGYLRRTGFNCQRISEALAELGYRKVKSNGTRLYRRVIQLPP